MPTIVNGKTLIRPQAVSFVTENPVIANQPPTQLTIGIIATSDGGKPREYKQLYSYNEAVNTFRSGLLVDLLKRVYNPSGLANGAYEVRAYRINAGVQSAGALKDGSAADVITLVSRDYGLHTNQVRVKVEAGTTAGYKVSVQGYASPDTISKDNIARDLFIVDYIGAGSAATATINSTGLTTAVTGGAAAESATFLFANYPTIQDLSNALVATGGYNVTILADTRTLSSTLDAISAQSILAAYTCKANTQAVVDFLNNETLYVVATRVNGNTLATANGYVNLTGGGNGGAIVQSDYQAALTALQGEECDIVLVGTADAAIHALVNEHCALMSSTGQNQERIAILGGADGETTDATIVRARNLNSFRSALCYPGIKDIDQYGVLTNYSPVYTAAAVAGIMAGLPIGTPGTRKTLRCVGLTKVIPTTEQDTLLLGGVLAVVPHRSEGARLVQSILTYTDSVSAPTNILRRELSSRIAADQVVKRVRQRLDDTVIGAAGGPLLLQQSQSVVETALKELQNEGLIVGDQENPAFSELSAALTGETITVSFKAAVVSPANYVVLQASLGTYSG